jgi:hypothetical protein
VSDGEGAARLALVRAWWREQRPPPPLGARLDRLYYVAITIAILGTLLYGTARSALADVVTADTVATWGPAVVLCALAAGARWGSFDGPVVFSPPDVAVLLSAPLPRAGLASRRLAAMLAWGALAGAVIGALAVVGLSGGARGVGAAAGAGLIGGCALAGVVAVALAALVQCSARWSRAAGVAAWLAVPVGAALVLMAHAGAAGREVAQWAGPWGWAVQPGAGVPAGRAGAALALLATAAAVAALFARRAYGTCPTERHVVRAAGREGVVSSLSAFDTRTARLALQGAGGPVAPGTRGLPAPSRPGLALPWRDATAARRSRARTAAGALAGAAAAGLALSDPARPAVALLAGTGLYVAGACLLEGLRLEVDRPSISRVLLVRPYGRVLAGHAVLPALIVAATCAVVAGACAAAGVLPARGGAVALLLVAAAPTAVLCAALSGRRGGRLPPSVLATGSAVDPSGGGTYALAWLAAWPAAAAALGGGPLIVVARASSAGSGLPAMLLVAVAAPVVLAALLAGSRPQ